MTDREEALTVMAAFLSRCARLIGREVTVITLGYMEYTGRLTSMGLQQNPPGVVVYLAGRKPLLIRQISLSDRDRPAHLPRRVEALPVAILPSVKELPPTTPEEPQT